MNRRTFLELGFTMSMTPSLLAALKSDRFAEAARILEKGVESKKVRSAVLHATQGQTSFTRSFGAATDDSMFLLGSISKPICITALMTLFDRGKVQLDDPVNKFVPLFRDEGRDAVTIRHLLTHVSGLPDQLVDNDRLRKDHANLSEFVNKAIQTPLGFPAGTRYQYSSMGILLAVHIAGLIAGSEMANLITRTVLMPLNMKHTAVGLGPFALQDMIPCQVEFAAPEAGGGDPAAKDWDWNSHYWRSLGSPWGGVHASAADVARFLAEFLDAKGAVVKPATAKLMITNQNPKGLKARGLGFDLGPSLGPDSSSTFGHSGSTGTLAWAHPPTGTICVVLTSLPSGAVKPHPRDLSAASVAAAIN